MQYSKTGLQLTQQFESCRLTAYQDSKGIWTIGWGTTHYPNGMPVQQGDTCTSLEADNWLMHDVQDAELTVNRALIFTPTFPTQNEFDALVDFVYNVGSENFLTSTLLRLLNVGNYQAAALEFDKWDYAGGKQVAGLLRRREAETSLFDEENQQS